MLHDVGFIEQAFCFSNPEKMRGKTQSFEDYTSKTHDAWCEDDDDVEKVGERVGSVIIQEPSVKVIRSGDVRTGILSRIKKKHNHGRLVGIVQSCTIIPIQSSTITPRIIIAAPTPL
jgi:hypothetical protein